MRPQPAEAPKPKVLFFVEGFTDIRFVTGLAEICDLTLAVPRRAFESSGLKERVKESGARLDVVEIDGGRLQYQLRTLPFLWKQSPHFDLILAQEVLRGALNATLVGKLKGVPVVTYMGISPLEYFRCRRERGLVGPLTAWLGETTIATLMRMNGWLATRCLAMGPYLRDVASHYCPRSVEGLYYGVDTDFFRGASPEEKARLREKLDLPKDCFLTVLSSRISHEKDPETALKAAALARERGLNLVLLNLGGGFKDFLALAERLQLRDAREWVLGRAAVHPMRDLADYFRSADCLIQSSLAEGAAFSTLEGLACEVPVIATGIGGMAVQLKGVAHLTPRQDAEAMAEKLLWVATHPQECRAVSARGRRYVVEHWNRGKAFADLRRLFDELTPQRVTR